MQERIPSAKPIGSATLDGYKFVCNKRSADGSGKGNIFRAEGDTVWGVVFEISKADLSRLDAFENGYDRVTMQVELDGKVVNAETYISDKLTGAPPTAEYMAYITSGAKEHELPAEYIVMLEGMETKG
ncbi:MAG: gamma-glutamylcyclotransferase [Anaerolineales bacterium]|nr:gamma-glutamylcyclotransferase [Anaerolineales bacterium]